MIELQNLTIANAPDRVLINDLSHTIKGGSLTALIGRNGTGKSTLIRIIAGLQKPVIGSVKICNVDISKSSATELAQVVTVVTTESIKVRNLTCRELVSLGRSPHTGLFGRLSVADNEIIDKSLDLVGMNSFRNRDIARLSDGEIRRVMLARALAQDTPVILLDEPTSFLDVAGRYDVCELLQELAHNQNKTILYSTHEIEPATQYSDSMMLISQNKVLILPPNQMLLNSEFKDLLGGRTLVI